MPADDVAPSPSPFGESPRQSLTESTSNNDALSSVHSYTYVILQHIQFTATATVTVTV